MHLGYLNGIHAADTAPQRRNFIKRAGAAVLGGGMAGLDLDYGEWGVMNWV